MKKKKYIYICIYYNKKKKHKLKNLKNKILMIFLDNILNEMTII